MGIHMTEPLAFRGTYADWKLIKTRGVIQIVMEVPLADADAAYNVLGGMPDSSREVWFAIAPLKIPVHQPAKETAATPQPATDKPQAGAKRMDWRELQPAAQAGIRSGEPSFWAFLREVMIYPGVRDADTAATAVRHICEVNSRSELGTNHKARVLWHSLDERFLAWKYIDA